MSATLSSRAQEASSNELCSLGSLSDPFHQRGSSVISEELGGIAMGKHFSSCPLTSSGLCGTLVSPGLLLAQLIADTQPSIPVMMLGVELGASLECCRSIPGMLQQEQPHLIFNFVFTNC